MNQAEYIAVMRSALGKQKRDSELTDRELKLHLKNSRKYIAFRIGRYCNQLKKSVNYVLGGGGIGAVFEEEKLPADFLVDVSALNNNNEAKKILYERKNALDDNTLYAASVSQPFYYIKAGKIGFTPTSSGTQGTLFYVATPTVFTSATKDETDLDPPFIPTEYQILCAKHACEIPAMRFRSDWKVKGEVETEIQMIIARSKGIQIEQKVIK